MNVALFKVLNQNCPQFPSALGQNDSTQKVPGGEPGTSGSEALSCGANLATVRLNRSRNWGYKHTNFYYDIDTAEDHSPSSSPLAEPSVILAAIKPEFALICASILLAMSGLFLRKTLALSRPWPMRSPL